MSLDFAVKNFVIGVIGFVKRLAMKFVADTMIGKLARWLRILGYDVKYDSSLPLKQLVDTSNREHRVFLTRRKSFPNGITPTTLFNVCSEYFPKQLHMVVHQFGLDTETGLFTRCVECNEVVRPVKKSAVKGNVPEKSWKGFDEFFECPGCHRVYWAGSHRINTLKRLRGILSNEQQEGDEYGTESRKD